MFLYQQIDSIRDFSPIAFDALPTAEAGGF